MKTTVLTITLGALVYSCSPTNGGISTTSARDALTAEEIATTTAQNAYEAISLKRPIFLQSRGPRSFQSPGRGQSNEYPVVYLDRMYYGELESLRLIPVQQISEIDYLDMNDAMVQFGSGHSGGIILIMTKPA